MSSKHQLHLFMEITSALDVKFRDVRPAVEDDHNDAYISTPEKLSVRTLPFLELDFIFSCIPEKFVRHSDGSQVCHDRSIPRRGHASYATFSSMTYNDHHECI